MIFFKKNIYVLFFVLLYSHSFLCAMKDGIFINTFPQNMPNIIDMDKDSKNANPVNLYVINEVEPKTDLMTLKLKNALLDEKADFNILVYYKTVEHLLAINGFVPNATTLTTDQAIFLENMLLYWEIMHVNETGYVLFVPKKSNTSISLGELTTFTYQLNTILTRAKKAFSVMEQFNMFLTIVGNCEKKHCNDVHKEVTAIEKMIKDVYYNIINIDTDLKKCIKDSDSNNFSLHIAKREKLLKDCIDIINTLCDFFKKEFYPEKYYKKDVQKDRDDLEAKKDTLSEWGKFKLLSLRERIKPIEVWHEAKKSANSTLLYIVQKISFFRMNYFDKKSGLPNALATVFNALAQNQQNSISTKKITMYLTGHGSTEPQIIADLNPDDVLALLVVCKNNAAMHAVVVDSCFTAGENRQWLLDSEIKFPLVFIGVDNLPTLSVLHVKANYPRLIFDQLNLSLKDIDALCNLCISMHVKGSLQMVENAPFIFDPACRMNIFGTQEACYVLDESRIKSKTKKIILPSVSFLYAAKNCMDITLNIGTKKYRGISVTFIEHFSGGVPLTGKEFALFNPKIGFVNPVVKSTVQEIDKEACMNLFPAFVPYDQKNETCFYIKGIKAYQDFGVFKIIRDMFLNGGRRYSSRSILIGSIEGENDLLQTLQESRRVNRIQVPSDFENILSNSQKYPANKSIKLRCIRINIIPSLNGNVTYEVSCALGHKVWKWTHDTKDIAASIDFWEVEKPVAYKNNFNSEVEKIKPKKNVIQQILPIQPNVIQPNVITITTNTPTQVTTSVAPSSSQSQLQKKGVKRKEREE